MQEKIVRVVCLFSVVFTLTLTDSRVCIGDDTASREAKLTELVSQVVVGKDGDYLTIQTTDSEHFIEVVRLNLEKESPLRIMIGTYHLSDDPSVVLKREGISLPKDWIITRWEAGVFAEFGGTVTDPKSIAIFVEKVITRILGSSSDYDLITDLGRLWIRSE